MQTSTPFAVQAELTRSLEREAASGDPVAFTVKALIRTDYKRLRFYGGDQVVSNTSLERLWVAEDELRICVEAASRDAQLTACVGFVKTVDHRPIATGWLLDDSGQVIDVANHRRQSLGFLGVELRATELASWLPSDVRSIAERDIHRLAV